MTLMDRKPASFAEAVKDARARLGLSLRDLAALTGISPTHLCDIEHDRRLASDESLENLTVMLKYQPGYLWALCGKVPPIVQVHLRRNPEFGITLHSWVVNHILPKE